MRLRARVTHLDEPYLLIIETCIATGARISEVLGLICKSVNLDEGTIKIVQRVWQQDIGRPTSEDSQRLLGTGDLVLATVRRPRGPRHARAICLPAEEGTWKTAVGFGSSR